MNKQTFIILAGDEQRRRNAVEFIESLSRDAAYRVKIEPFKRDRSEAQRGLMWLWHTTEAKEGGMTKAESHHGFKERHCLPILLRDDEDGRLRRMWGMMEYAAPEIREQFIDMLSTSLLDMRQMSEALTEYDMTAARAGISFPRPEDLWHEAMAERLPVKYRRTA